MPAETALPGPAHVPVTVPAGLLPTQPLFLQSCLLCFMRTNSLEIAGELMRVK